MTMKMYLASAWERADEMDKYARLLRKVGQEVTSKWHSDVGNHFVKQPRTKDQEKYNATVAQQDLADLMRADAIVYFPTRVYGVGHHTEFGFAIARGMSLFCVGEPVGVFPWHPRVVRFKTWEVFLEAATPESYKPHLTVVPAAYTVREGDRTEDGVQEP